MSSVSETSESSDDETTISIERERFTSSGKQRFRTPNKIINDEALYCVDCNVEFHGDCPNHGPLTIVEDVQPGDETGGAKETAPAQVVIRNAGVWTRDVIPARVRFGPLVGKSVPLDNASSRYSWLIRKFGEEEHCVDASDAKNSNWMRYVDCALQFDQRNMEAIQHRGHIYFVTTRRVQPKQELLVWSGPKPEKEDQEAPHVEEVSDVVLKALSKLEKLRFTCVKCKTAFPSMEVMAAHIKSGCPVEPVPASIPSSVPSPVSNSETFSTKISDESESEDSEGSQDHTPGKSYTCHCCPKKFPDKSGLFRHQRIHEREKTYACNHCDKKYFFEYQLSRHLEMHAGNKKHACTYCDKKYYYTFQLTAHIRSHTGERPYECVVCDKTFSRSDTLNSHLRTHTEEKPYACQLCDKKFSVNSALHVHIRVHKKEKPHACKYCDGKFVSKHALERHFRKHSGEKPYACSHCDKCYTGSSALNRHLRKHPQENGNASP